MHDAHATPPDLPETTLPPGRRGAAGAAVLNAELMLAEKLLD